MTALYQSLAVAVGGALGSLGRFWLGLWLAPLGSALPVGTIVINIVGSFVIGFFGTLTLSHGRYPAPELLRILVLVGVCGGFTTFSSFSLQTLDLLRGGAPGRAAINVALSVVLCLAAVAAGHLLAAQFNGGAVQIAQLPMEEEA